MASRLRVAVAAAGMLIGVLAGIPAGSLAPRDAVAADAAVLRFLKDGVEVGRVDLATLRAKGRETTVTVDDPYYERSMTYRAVPLATALALGFGEPPSAFAGEDVVLRAADGYARPTTGARLAEAGGFLAFGDASRPADPPAFLPMGRRALDPAPFYVVWTGAGQKDPHASPWPYQLVAVERQDFVRSHPHTVPRSAPDGSPAWTGFRVFRTECVACHAVNGEGGTVGPDLNVPQSIVEYRPAEQIKAYIRDPATFRYGNMPANPHLGAAELDGLIAYFETMRRAKHDPRAARAAGAGG
jgi:mono/diheme cytochrome c family protein